MTKISDKSELFRSRGEKLKKGIKEIEMKNDLKHLRRSELIDLKLPVLSEWSYLLLKKAPCRYSGSAYLDNLVIVAHNYRTHFGKLKELEVGTEVIFTDAAGNRFEYKVAAVEALTPQSVEDMTSGEWALSLFTCTLDGKSRVTVRCEAADRTSCEVKSERFV